MELKKKREIEQLKVEMEIIKKSQKLKDKAAYKIGSGIMAGSTLLEAPDLFRYLMGMKKGGRVGCGVAKRGFGKAMKRKG